MTQTQWLGDIYSQPHSNIHSNMSKPVSRLECRIAKVCNILFPASVGCSPAKGRESLHAKAKQQPLSGTTHRNLRVMFSMSGQKDVPGVSRPVSCKLSHHYEWNGVDYQLRLRKLMQMLERGSKCPPQRLQPWLSSSHPDMQGFPLSS